MRDIGPSEVERTIIFEHSGKPLPYVCQVCGEELNEENLGESGEQICKECEEEV